MRAVAARQIVERRARREVAIRGVHGHDAMLDLLEKRDRIEAADQRIRRIVLDAEVRRIDPIEDLEEDVLRLRELRIPPGAVLVVVLHAQHDVAALGVVERSRGCRRRVRAMPSARDSPGYRWPLNVRQCRAPSRTVRSMAAFCRSTCRRRSSASGCVKSGEKQIIE